MICHLGQRSCDVARCSLRSQEVYFNGILVTFGISKYTFDSEVVKSMALQSACLGFNPGCIPCFLHDEDKFDKSVSTPTLCQPLFLAYINLCQVEITQNYSIYKRKTTIVCAKTEFFLQQLAKL